MQPQGRKGLPNINALGSDGQRYLPASSVPGSDLHTFKSSFSFRPVCVCVWGGSKNVLVPHFALAYITVTDSATPITGIGVT